MLYSEVTRARGKGTDARKPYLQKIADIGARGLALAVARRSFGVAAKMC
jgi:hypothetical protein